LGWESGSFIFFGYVSTKEPVAQMVARITVSLISAGLRDSVTTAVVPRAQRCKTCAPSQPMSLVYVNFFTYTRLIGCEGAQVLHRWARGTTAVVTESLKPSTVSRRIGLRDQYASQGGAALPSELRRGTL
jgi:hypothetical protein